MDFQQSKTFINLQNAYEYELRTSAKFEMFGAQANQDVLLEISNIFNTASRNGRFISERLRRILYNGDTDVVENLTEAYTDEQNAKINLYNEYSRIASEEGYNDIASLFNGIGNIKINHFSTFQDVLRDIENNELFCKKEENLWICLGCGNILSGLCAPENCPVCGYPQGFYQLHRFR